MTAEDLYIKNIENGIRGIRSGTKTPKDSNVGTNLNRLKALNLGLYQDYLAEYKVLLEELKTRTK